MAIILTRDYLKAVLDQNLEERTHYKKIMKAAYKSMNERVTNLINRTIFHEDEMRHLNREISEILLDTSELKQERVKIITSMADESETKSEVDLAVELEMTNECIMMNRKRIKSLLEKISIADNNISYINKVISELCEEILDLRGQIDEILVTTPDPIILESMVSDPIFSKSENIKHIDCEILP